MLIGTKTYVIRIICPGKERVFVDMTPQIFEVLIRRKVKEGWDRGEDPMGERWETPMEAVRDLTKGLSDGEPYVITV